MSCRTPGCVAPADADHSLHKTSDTGLLAAYASLTRRMQREEDHMGGSGSTETRDQRNLVEGEILRRMEGA